MGNGNDIRNVMADTRQPQSYHSGNEDGQPHRELGSAQRSSSLCAKMALATTPTDRGYKETNFQPGQDGNPQVSHFFHFSNYEKSVNTTKSRNKTPKSINAKHNQGTCGISWNCKGVKTAATLREIKRLCRIHQPEFLF